MLEFLQFYMPKLQSLTNLNVLWLELEVGHDARYTGESLCISVSTLVIFDLSFSRRSVKQYDHLFKMLWKIISF